MNPIAIPRQPSRRRWPWLLLLAGSGICCAAILLFPWLVLWGEAAAALSIRVLFSHICHQDPQRSLSLAGIVLPVCTRCLALYLGGFPGSAAGSPGPRAFGLAAGVAGPAAGAAPPHRAGRRPGPGRASGPAPSGRGPPPAGWPARRWGSTRPFSWKAVAVLRLNRTAGIWDNDLEGAEGGKGVARGFPPPPSLPPRASGAADPPGRGPGEQCGLKSIGQKRGKHERFIQGEKRGLPGPANRLGEWVAPPEPRRNTAGSRRHGGHH